MKSHRTTGQYLRAARHLPTWIGRVYRAHKTFRNAGSLVAASVTGTPLERLETRDGRVLHLTSCPLDPHTALLIWCGGEYDPLPVSGTVVDVGANYGAFAVYAERRGLRVFAVEPNGEAHAALLRNAGPNVTATRAAIWHASGETLYMAAAAHPGNELGEQSARLTEPVTTLSLGEFLDVHRIETVDLLKLDCEGAEYSILPSLPEGVWRKIRAIDLEYHAGRGDEMVRIIEAAGLVLQRHKQGKVWGMSYGRIRAERPREVARPSQFPRVGGERAGHGGRSPVLSDTNTIMFLSGRTWASGV